MKEKKRTITVLIVLGIIFLLALSFVLSESNSKEEYELIANTPTVIDLGSDCYTCTTQRGYLDKLKEKYEDSINVWKIDIYKNPEEAEKYEVKVVPTLIFLDKDGKQVERHEGLLTDAQLEEKLTDLKLIEPTCSVDGEGC